MSRRSQITTSADRTPALAVARMQQHEALAVAVIVVAAAIVRAGTVLACAARTASAISRTESGSGTLIGSARWLMSSSVAAAEQAAGRRRAD